MLPVRPPAKKHKTMHSMHVSSLSSPIASKPRVLNFTSPAASSSASASTRLVTPLINQTSENSSSSLRTAPLLLSPKVDLIHHRFDCEAPNVEPFQPMPFSEASNLYEKRITSSSPLVRINAQSCSKCLCYVCDQPVQNCKEWETLHCNAHDKDPKWMSLKESRAIPRDPSSLQPPVSLLLGKKKVTVNMLKSILRRNGQHVTGKKQILLDRIADGETYGKLAHCPNCRLGRLKLSEQQRRMVFCHGFFQGDTFHACTFGCETEEAPRSGNWRFDGYPADCVPPEDDKEEDLKAKSAAIANAMNANVETCADLLRGNEKLKVPELKEILGKNGQHMTGRKKTLLLRIADGRKYGRLDGCPMCLEGRLKVHAQEDGEIVVFCPGFWDYNAYSPVPCTYQVPPKDAPRAGPWKE